MNAEWRWDFAIEILPSMLWATLNTILAAGIGYAIAAIMGLIFSLSSSRLSQVNFILSLTFKDSTDLIILEHLSVCFLISSTRKPPCVL